MNREALLGLALAAIDDAEAMAVFTDAREEGALNGMRCASAWLTEAEWARAVAAELLFESWSTSWPLAERCQRPRIPRVGVGTYDIRGVSASAMFIDELGTWNDDILSGQRQGNGT